MARGNKVVEEEPIQKIYWTIGEVAIMAQVSPSCIRFWEKEFNIILHRNRKGNRYFTRENINQIKLINNLLNVEGYTIKGAKRQVELKLIPIPLS